MRITSLGLRSDLMFHRFSGMVVDRGTYLLVHTPDNPDYFWGNFLIFPAPPSQGDCERWLFLFEKELGHRAGIHHQAFIWDGTCSTADLSEFKSREFSVESTTVMTSRHLSTPRKPHRGLAIKKVETAREWEEVLELQIATTQSSFAPDAYRTFMTKKFTQYRSMTEKGLGHWFAAYLGSKLVADLGIFFDEDIGRFQNVETHAEYRRQGICQTLVYQVSTWMLERDPSLTLVVEADVYGDAERIYTSLGYVESEQRTSLCRYDAERWQSANG
jgi:GNAT superfamily N-acetyltransferase